MFRFTVPIVKKDVCLINRDDPYAQIKDSPDRSSHINLTQSAPAAPQGEEKKKGLVNSLKFWKKDKSANRDELGNSAPCVLYQPGK